MAIVNRRMKVMHIISGDLWAGAEVQAYTLLTTLKSDCDLHVILMNPGELAERLMDQDIPVTILNESQQGSISLVWQMRNIMLTFRPDIIHTHRQKENILGSLANLLSVRAASLRTCHGAPEFAASGMRRIQQAADKLIGCYLQAAIIAVSQDLYAKLIRIFPEDKVHTINNGVDVEALHDGISAADFRNDQPGAMHVGIAGRLEPVKRVDIFLQMAALLKENYKKELYFHIFGDGSLRQQLEVESTKLGLDDKLTFYGHRTDMANCIAALDLVVICSDHEGTPMVALETLALGKLLVAHSVGGLKEVLEDYPLMQVSKHSPEGYAAVVMTVLDSAPHSIRLKDRYLKSHNAQETLKLYALLL